MKKGMGICWVFGVWGCWSFLLLQLLFESLVLYFMTFVFLSIGRLVNCLNSLFRHYSYTIYHIRNASIQLALTFNEFKLTCHLTVWIHTMKDSISISDLHTRLPVLVCKWRAPTRTSQLPVSTCKMWCAIPCEMVGQEI